MGKTSYKIGVFTQKIHRIMSNGIHKPILADSPVPSMLRVVWVLTAILSGILALSLSVLVMFQPDRFESQGIDAMVNLNGILWAAVTLLIVVPMIGIRPPRPEPEPVPEKESHPVG